MFPIRLEVLRRTHQQDEDLARAIQKYKALATCPQRGTAKAGRGAAPGGGAGAGNGGNQMGSPGVGLGVRVHPRHGL